MVDNRLLSLLGVESCVAFRIEHYCSRMLVAGTRLCIVVEIARQTLRGKIRVVYLGISVSTESTRVPVSKHPRQPHQSHASLVLTVGIMEKETRP